MIKTVGNRNIMITQRKIQKQNCYSVDGEFGNDILITYISLKTIQSKTFAIFR